MPRSIAEKPQEWEVGFGQLCFNAFKNGLWHSEATFTKDIKDFIRQLHAKDREEIVNIVKGMYKQSEVNTKHEYLIDNRQYNEAIKDILTHLTSKE